MAARARAQGRYKNSEKIHAQRFTTLAATPPSGKCSASVTVIALVKLFQFEKPFFHVVNVSPRAYDLEDNYFNIYFISVSLPLLFR